MLKGWAFSLLAALALSIGASGCLDEVNCTPADTTHSCCVKNNIANPSACDGIEGVEGAAFRGTSATGQGTVSSGKRTAATVGAAATIGAGAVLVSMNNVAQFKELQAKLDKLMEECADMAERVVDAKRPKGEILNPARCNETVGKDSEGKPVTRAMQLGNEKHEEALECVKEKLGKQIQGHFSIEQRYRHDKATRSLELVSTEEERRLVQQGRKHELKGTLKPDVVIHSGNPKQVRIIYDFKFPCVKGALGTWRIYNRGPHQDSTQGQLYEQALGVQPGRVLPGKKGIIR